MRAGRPRLAAHRGGARLWPENSLGAFRRAIALGVDDLELDVHLTADGEVAVIHDRTLDRTTTGRGRVRSWTSADLRRLRLRGPDGAVGDEPMPMLDDVLALVAPTPVGLLVEIKDAKPAPRYAREGGVVRRLPGAPYEGLEERVLAALQRAGLAARASVMAFNAELVARVRVLAPSQRTTLLVGRADVERAGAGVVAAVGWAREVGATELGLEHGLVSAAVAGAARDAGLLLGAWTVDDEAEMRRLAALGVDAITTDRPDVARRLFLGQDGGAGGTG